MNYSQIQKAVGKEAFRRQVAYVAEAHTVIDVGAWIGQTVNGYRRLYPKAQIHAFEPQPRQFDRLVRRFAGASDTTIWSMAMSNWTGTQTLHVTEPGYETSLLEPTSEYLATGICRRQDVRVTTTALDTFCQQQGIDRIDVLKMDVQGNELRVLQGARGLFDRDCVGLVFAELNFCHKYEGQCWWYDVGAWLAGYGFELRELAPQWRQSRAVHANGLFFKEVS